MELDLGSVASVVNVGILAGIFFRLGGIIETTKSLIDRVSHLEKIAGEYEP